MKWDRVANTFSFKVKLKDMPTLTKRSLLSEIASIYDPVGFAAPVIVTAKCLTQEVWVTGTDWDEPVTPEIKAKYEAFRQELSCWEQIIIP